MYLIKKINKYMYNDVHEAFYQTCEIHGPLVKGSGPEVRRNGNIKEKHIKSQKIFISTPLYI